MNKRIILSIVLIGFLIGLADYVTTIYGLSIGLVESDGLYFPFLSTLVFSVYGLTVYFSTTKLNKKLYNYMSFIMVSLFTVFLSLPIINNMSLII